MPIDASIPLGIKQPDQMQNLSSLLGVANGAQTLQQNQQKTQQGAIDLQERQGMQQFLSDMKNITDEQGNIDPAKMQAGIAKFAPTTGFKYMQGYAEANKAHAEATKALNGLTTDNRVQIGSVLTSLPDDAPPDLVHKTVDALNDQYKGRLTPLVSIFKGGYDNAVKTGGSAGAQAFIKQQAKSVLPQTTQQDIDSGGVAAISTDKGTQFVQTKTGAAQPQGSQVGSTLAPPNQITTTPTGRVVTLNPATGNSQEPQAANNAPPVNFPVGESAQTHNALQDERTAAKNVALQAPQMHDINRTIVDMVNKGANTGKFGEYLRAVRSNVLGMNDVEGANEYDILGKMLERSALTAAQSMGPHTNAGLEASVKANGSLAYGPTALKKIAYLNDALTSGAELYHQGMENAVANSPKNIFAKRDFDSAWSKVATPQVLRLKNAVDNGNSDEISAITKEVGGSDSAGAWKLHKQLTELLKLSGR